MNADKAKKRLPLVYAIFLIIIILFPFAHYGNKYWPVAGWKMYSTKMWFVPAEDYSMIELRVFNEADKEVSNLNIFDLLHFSRAKELGEDLLEEVFVKGGPEKDAQSIIYVKHLVQKAMPGADIKKIEGYRVFWKVDPFKNPPYDKYQPHKKDYLSTLPFN